MFQSVHRRSLGLLGLVLLLPACTWVKISDEARAIPIRESHQVADCERLGNITTQVAWKVMGIPRGENKIRVELDNLARDRALNLGANAVVRESISEGTGNYTAYKCP